MTLLEGRNLRKNYRLSRSNSLDALRGVDVAIGAGEMVAIMGHRAPARPPSCTCSACSTRPTRTMARRPRCVSTVRTSPGRTAMAHRAMPRGNIE
jgi:hypothetical protein